MFHKAWNSKGEVSFCFPRSSIKFQGHTVQNITDFDPNLAFPDYRPVAAFKSLRFALLFFGRLFAMNFILNFMNHSNVYIWDHYYFVSFFAQILHHRWLSVFRVQFPSSTSNSYMNGFLIPWIGPVAYIFYLGVTWLWIIEVSHTKSLACNRWGSRIIKVSCETQITWLIISLLSVCC